MIETSNKYDQHNHNNFLDFTDEDLLLLKFISLLAGQTLQNSALYEEAVTRRRQQEALVREERREGEQHHTTPVRTKMSWGVVIHNASSGSMYVYAFDAHHLMHLFLSLLIVSVV